MNQLGYYGKTPHRGDFVRFNLPQCFINVWDDWLQHVIVQGEQTHGDWAERYHQAPGYRFVLSSGVAGNEVWIGLLQPSQDKVGRRFPFCIAMSLPDTALPCVCTTSHASWFEQTEALLARVLSSDYVFDQLQEDLSVIATRFEHQDTGVDNPLTTLNDNPADNMTVNVASENALQHSLLTPAVLDTVLAQTVSEYSVWMSCDLEHATTTLASGLPSESAGVALFTREWQTGASARLDLGLLARSVGSALSLFTAVTGPDDEEEAPTLPMTHSQTGIHDAPEAETLESDAIHDPDGEPAEPADSQLEQAPSLVAEIPTADDWAALDEFDDGSDELAAVVVPEVEPLELDEDDQPEAPWEK